MKILLTTDKLARGGKEKQILLLGNGLLKRGYNVFILSKNEIDKQNFFTEVNFPLDRIQTLGKNNSYKQRKRFTTVVYEINPSVILNFDVKSSLWAERFTGRANKIATINCTIRRATPYNTFKSRILAKMCLKRSKYIVSNTETGLQLYNIQKSKNHQVIYNGIDLERFKNATALKREDIFDKNIPKSAIVIANIGSLYEHKGQQTLINALSKVDNTNIYVFILGEGPQRHSLQTRIEDLGLSNRVKLLGRQKNIEQYLKSADFYINPSWGEGCSNAMLEAMACNLPVITTRNGGTPEIIHPKTTRYFRKNDTQDLAHSITLSETLTSNTNELEQWMEQFSLNIMIDQYEDFIKNTVIRDLS